MGDGKAIPGSRQHSIAQWQQYYFSGKGSIGAKPAGSKPSKGQKKGDKGSKGGKGGKATTVPAEPTRSISKPPATAAPASSELPNWSCPRCKFTANWPHRQKCVVCQGPVPNAHKAKVAKALGIDLTAPAAADASEPPVGKPVGPLVSGTDQRKLNERITQLEQARAVMVRENVCQQEVDRVDADLSQMHHQRFVIKSPEAKRKYHERHRDEVRAKIDGHQTRCDTLQAAVEKAEQQLAHAKGELEKHQQNLQPWQEKLKHHEDALKSLDEGGETEQHSKPQRGNGEGEATQRTLAMVSSLLDAFAIANPASGKLVEALSELIQNSAHNSEQVEPPDEPDDKMGDTETQHEAAADGEEPEVDQTLEQIQQEIAATETATRTAQQRAHEKKAAADLREQERVQLLNTVPKAPEDLLKEQAELAQKAAQAEAAEEAKRQARRLLQAERDKLAAAEQSAAAEEQRAQHIARGCEEVRQQCEKANREAEAIAAEVAKRAYAAGSNAVDDEDPGGAELDEREPKKHKDETPESSQQASSDAAASKGDNGPGGGKGSGSTARDESHPYSPP